MLNQEFRHKMMILPGDIAQFQPREQISNKFYRKWKMDVNTVLKI